MRRRSFRPRPGAPAGDGSVQGAGEARHLDVQYKGIAPVVQDVVGGQIPMGPADTVVALPQLRSGKMRALASFSENRLAVTADVPSKLTGLGLEIIGDTPEQFAAFLQEEGRRWLPLIRSLNIKLD